jgi:NADP-dependent 3-hydroxy acid dehydrogenase YdfG
MHGFPIGPSHLFELSNRRSNPSAKEIDKNSMGLQSEDVAETVAFVAAVPKHVNLTEITILPTAQII